MPKLNVQTRAFASPGKYIQGAGEISNLKEYTEVFGKKVFFLIDVFFFDSFTKMLIDMYDKSDSFILTEKFGGEVTELEIARVTDLARAIEPQVVVGIGGGKTLDTAKAVADNYNAFVIIVPTTASTDAPTSGLSVIYNEKGEHIYSRPYKKNPDITLLDSEIIVNAPIRFMVSGMGDALSTYFEARANQQSDSPNYVGKGYRRCKVALAIAELCYKTLIEKGLQAKIEAELGLLTEAVEDIIEANTLLSGLGFENTSCAGAHSVGDGLAALPDCAKYLHGEKVAFGVICQLIAENRPISEIEEVIKFSLSVGLPVTLEAVGVNPVTDEKIKRIAEASLHSFWDVEPFSVTQQNAFNAIKAANVLGHHYIK